MFKKKILNILTSNGKIPLSNIVSWLLCDEANSFFQIGILTLYYGIWIVQDTGVSEFHYSWAVAIVEFLIIILGPFIGAIADKHNMKKHFLIFFLDNL